MYLLCWWCWWWWRQTQLYGCCYLFLCVGKIPLKTRHFFLNLYTNFSRSLSWCMNEWTFSDDIGKCFTFNELSRTAFTFAQFYVLSLENYTSFFFCSKNETQLKTNYSPSIICDTFLIVRRRFIAVWIGINLFIAWKC